MRKRTDRRIGDLLGDNHALDAGEQEELVQAFETLQVEQAAEWRCLWGCITGALALAHVYLGARQLTSPWDLKHHAAFQDSAPVGLLELLSGACLAVSAAALVAGHERQGLAPAQHAQRTRLERRLLDAALFGSLVLLLLWGRALEAASQGSSMGLRDVAALAWLPLTPLLLAGVARYVVAQQHEAASGVRHLRAQTYAYKGA